MGQTLAEEQLPPQASKVKPNKYAPKPKVGAEKTVSAPGMKVTKVGLGHLVVEHTNPQDYKAH